MALEQKPVVQCPVCSQGMESFRINSHLDHCLGLRRPPPPGKDREEEAAESSEGEAPSSKRARLSRSPGREAANSRSPGREAATSRSPGREAATSRSPGRAAATSRSPGREAATSRSPGRAAATSRSPGREAANSRSPGGQPAAAAPLFALFHKTPQTSRARGTDELKRPGPSPGRNVSSSAVVSSSGRESPDGPPAASQEQEKLVSLQQLEAKPLADLMRPSVLGELIGQSKVLGENTLLRTLLESHEIPSIILWGPPGCGKTSLAHVIASNSKKQSSTRFVSLSATSTSTTNIREVIKQAQNERKLFKRRTIVFFDEIHHFNKTQQDTFLPHVECGTITLIGATTENPSFQINAALLSRCRVIVLEKLSVEAMETILLRALNSLGIGILGQDKEAGSMDGSKESELHISIEPEAIRSIAYLCDGDARAALNGLHLAIQAKVASTKKPQNNNVQQNTPTKKIVIKEVHIKEGLQRSHILYDRAGEEHYNCISALHKTMRASDEKSALYWLARMLEGGEDPLYVARRLVRFASEDVGLADPLALTQAVSAYQGCHFIGMPECEVILAQCVVYLARAPKSVEVYMAYEAVKESVRNHKGPLPSVPLQLRNAPTKLMKDLGYGKGYKYPAFSKLENGPSPTKE
ncbi:ATPase WRNIP1 isoform X2 [Heptranchias perlo]|uniref:ATPase WRNIP1 isoform X2 n=1 Tax=Heptranchias perlo TaxID=212740 RepID=UPI0035593F82